MLACATVLLPSDTAKAQYFSLGVSIGGGTTVAAHMGIHYGDTEDRRSNLSSGQTEIEFVLGLPLHDVPDGHMRPGVSFGMNVRRTDEDTGLSIGAGFRIAPTAIDSTTDWQTVFHIPVGWEPYPVPVRPFVYFGYGRRFVPDGEGGLTSKWGYLVPWPQLQVYLAHTGGFHWT